MKRKRPKYAVLTTGSLASTVEEELGSIWRVDLRVDFVSEDVLVEGFGDGLVEPSQQLEQGLAAAPFEHGQRVVSVCCGGNTADRIELAERDLAISDQLRDVGQEHGYSGLLPGCVFL